MVNYTTIKKGNYNPITELWDEDLLTIQTAGCGCCGANTILTKAVLNQAIQDAEAWLEELKSVDERSLPE